jgi:phosphate transport system protein
MSPQARFVFDQELSKLSDDILQLASMVDTAIDRAMTALYNRDVRLAQDVDAGDEAINRLRYEIEEKSVRILATQQPTASDLRMVIAAIHLAVELERIADHAAGVARLVARMEEEDKIESLHKLPKMARRARRMIEEGIKAYIEQNPDLARNVLERDDKIDKQYNKLFRETVKEMRDEAYIRRATYLLWVGHNLERIGDRATNIAERVIFMTTGEFVEAASEID